MRLDRLRWPEWLIVAGGVVLLAAMLALPWYRGANRSLDGWNGLTHLRWVLLAAIVLALATGLLQATLRAPAIPVTVTLFTAALGGAAVAVLIYRVAADAPGGTAKPGGFVALVAALGVTYGGWRSLRTDGVAQGHAPEEIRVISSVPGPGPASGAPGS